MGEVDPIRLLADLAEVVSSVREANPATDLAIDGLRPAIVCRPGTAAEAAAALAVADRHGAAVAPTGGGTKLGLGNPPRRLDVLLSLDRLTGIVDYSPADLTVTCRAGTPWRDLQAHLADHGQFVPLDPPFANRATVGGILATNSHGPSRTGHGTARDHLIGVQIANPNGALTKAGGKVVKNVAGYDLNKLYIGSLGTVGVITEATWKLLPLPVASATVHAAFDRPEAAVATAIRVVRGGLQPRCAQLVAGSLLTELEAVCQEGQLDAGEGDPTYHLFVRFTGRPERVARQVAETRTMADVPGIVVIGSIAEDAEFWTVAASLPRPVDASIGPDTGVAARIAVRPTDLPAVLRAIRDDRSGWVADVSALAALGVLRIGFNAEGHCERAASFLAGLRAQVAAAGGSLVIEAASQELKRRIDVWGDPGEGLPIMRRLKQNLDPNGILNPGRFVARI